MFFLLVVILLLSLYLIAQKNRAMNRRLIILVLSYFFSLCSMILYISKDTYYYNLIKDYFYLPEVLWRWLFFIQISKSSILWLMNIFSTCVLIISVHFSLSFLGVLPPRYQKRMIGLSYLYSAVQLIIYAPRLSIAAYKFLYPNYLSPAQYKTAQNIIFALTRSLNILIILAGFVCLLFAIQYSPKMRLFQFNHIFLAISYGILSLVYIFFLSVTPSFYIKVSKIADTYSYLPIKLAHSITLYRMFPYLVIPALAIITYCAYRLGQLNNQASVEELYISRGIRSSETTSKIFCHYIKNEILALQSEIELLTDTKETQRIKEDVLKRCDTIFARVDELHRTTKTNQLNLKYCSVETVIEQTLEHFTHELSAIQFEKKYMNKECIAFIDPVYIGQALHNIIHNAFDAMEELPENQKHLKIRLEVLSRWIQISIKDNGKGISPDNLRKVFLPFYSSHAYSKHWGVGLTLTYKIIQAHEGKIQINSEPGVGTQFEILLPYANHLHEMHQFPKPGKERKSK